MNQHLKIWIGITLSVVALQCPLMAQVDTLTLQQAIQDAMSHNAQLQAAKLKIDQAQSQVDQAIGSALPNLKVNIASTRTDSFQSRYMLAEFLGGGLSSATADAMLRADNAQSAYSLGVSSQMVLGFYTLPVIANSHVALQIAQDTYEATRQSIEYQTYDAYFGVIKITQYSRQMEKTIQVVQGMLDQVQAAKKVGLVTNSDVLRTQIRLKQTEAALSEAQKMQQLAYYRLNLILGNSMDGKPTLDESIVDSMAAPHLTHSIQEDMDLATNRPSMKVMYQTAQLMRTAVSIQSMATYPTLVFSGNYGYQSLDGFTTNPRNHDWAIVGAVSWTLFDGFTNSAKTRETELNLAQLEKNIEQTKNSVQIEVMDALLSLQNAKQTIENAELSVQYAKEDLAISIEKEKSGAGIQQQVLDSQLTLQQAETALLNAKFDLLLNQVKIDYVTGQLSIQKGER